MEALKQILERLSQYNIVTNILPGAILCIILKYLVGYDLFFTGEWLLLGILFYFVGVINNRVGAVIIRPFFKWIHFIKPKPYSEYVRAEKKDVKLLTITTESSVFRSYVAVCFLSLLSILYKTIAEHCSFIANHTVLILLILLFILFAFSYRKQVKYAHDRIGIINEDE